jgi:hypothetical protein
VDSDEHHGSDALKRALNAILCKVKVTELRIYQSLLSTVNSTFCEGDVGSIQRRFSTIALIADVGARAEAPSRNGLRDRMGGQRAAAPRLTL